VLPVLCTRLQSLCAQRNYAEALAVHEMLVPVHAALFREPSPAGIKYAASLLGLCGEECRLPLVPLTEPSRLAIRAALTAVELTRFESV